MHTLKKYIPFLFISWLLVNLLYAAERPPGGGGPGEYWVHFQYDIHVADPDGNPLSNIEVRMTAVYGLMIGGDWQSETVSTTGFTNSTGDAHLDIWEEVSNWYPDNYQFSYMWAEVIETPDNVVSTSIGDHSDYPTGTAQFVLINPADDENGNLIMDAYETPLINKFSPTLVLDAGDQGLSPKSVEIMLESSLIYEDIYSVIGQEWHNSYNWFPNIDFSNIMSDAGFQGSWVVVYHLDFPGDTPSEWFQYFNSIKNNYSNTIYAHLFIDNPYIVIQYWFFYPFNDFINNHEGDWEHINVLLDSQNPSQAEIVRVDYYFHHFILEREQPGIDFHVEDNTHPVVFVGGYSTISDGWGSHGSYPIFGLWLAAAYDPNYPLEDDVYISELVSGDGDYLKYNTFQLVLLPEPDQIDYSANPEMSWLAARIYWGQMWVPSPGAEELQTLNDWKTFLSTITLGILNLELPNDVGNAPPWGPKWNPGWNQTGVVGDVYVEYTETPPPFQNWNPPQDQQEDDSQF